MSARSSPTLPSVWNMSQASRMSLNGSRCLWVPQHSVGRHSIPARRPEDEAIEGLRSIRHSLASSQPGVKVVELETVKMPEESKPSGFKTWS